MMPIAIVTGASSGIGQATAKALTNNGWKVYGTSRSCESGNFRNNIHWIQLNLNDSNSITAAFNFFKTQEKELHLLVNNAGIGFAAPALSTSSQELKEVFESNVFGPLEVIKSFISLMPKDSNAKVINVSSIGGAISLPYRSAYCASKFAMEAFSESLSIELKDSGIEMIILQPGDVKTNINTARITGGNIKESEQKKFNNTLTMINDEVNHGISPEKVAQKIIAIARNSKNPLRIKVGKGLQKLTPILKFILPSRLFEALIMNHYKIKK